MDTRTEQEAIEALDAITSNPGTNHCEADAILLSVVSEEVRKAYKRVSTRQGRFWYE